MDSLEGHMAQNSGLHPMEPVMVYTNRGGEQKDYYFSLNLDTQGYQFYVHIYSDAVHTIEWIRSRDIDDFLMESQG